MDLLVTGGAGFLGAHLADRMLSLGARVTVFDNLSRPGAEDAARRLNARHDRTGRLSFVFRDVRDPAEVERVLPGHDAVFHAAGIESEESALLDPREDYSTRVTGTFNVLEAMRARSPLTHLIIPSSSAVYGTPPIIRGCATFAATEKQLLAPENPYASGSACAEKYAIAWSHAYGLKVSVLRLATVYGTDAVFAKEQGWVARLIAAGRGGFAVAPPADPRWPVDLVHVDDVCEAAIAAWRSPAASIGQAFNVGGGAKEAPSLFEIADLIAMLGGKLSLLPPIGNAKPAFVLDTHRMQRATGWTPDTGWKEGLTRLFHATDPMSVGPAPDESEAKVLVAWPRAEGLA